MKHFSGYRWWAVALAGAIFGATACTPQAGTQQNASSVGGAAARPAGAVSPLPPIEDRVHPTKVVQKDGKWQLIRDGQPYFIKGAGGDAPKEFLAQIGGNSFRTWGIGPDTDKQLKEAQQLGLTVSFGYWLGVKRYFSYADEAQNQKQIADVRAAIERYKDSPPLLIWALGNEMEVGFEGEAKVRVFKHIQLLAEMAHKLDPNHPTMTVVAEIGGENVQLIHKYCPDIDIIGINTYAGASNIAKRYADAGGTKPYILTEYGPPGVWEWHEHDNAQKAVSEPNSTEKAEWYRNAYNGSIADKPEIKNSLGSYAFTWGAKQEATATWYGLVMNYNGGLYHTKAVDVMQEMWTGKPPAVRVPEIVSAKLDGIDPKVGALVRPGAIVKASAVIKDPQDLSIIYSWHLHKDPQNYNTGGENQAAPPEFPFYILKNGMPTVSVKLPPVKGAYRLFLFAYNSKGGVATANFPIKVEGEPIPNTPEETAAEKPKAAALPFVVYSDDAAAMPYNPTGFMPAAIGTNMALDAKCADTPHSGKSCIKVDYKLKGGWGGIVFQDPDNDWGNAPLGYDLTGAKNLTFWARGEKGGETATFGYGILFPKKPEMIFGDTANGKLASVALTKEWKQYTIPVSGDLSRIKTGFWLTTGPSGGQPTTFYLDDIQYNK
jgi:hypothetical protein